MTAKKPLEGIRVLDMTRVLAGPYCTMILHRLGAEVIKIEQPGTGDDSRQYGPYMDSEQKVSAYFHTVNWGKKSITVNLKKPAGKQLILDLVPHCDVLVENFRPGTLEKLELDQTRLRAINPRLIFASASGFGQTGPFSGFAAYDVIVQALSGLMSINGEEDGAPVKVGESVADIITGIFSALGVIAALYGRDRADQPGTGTRLDISMLDSIIAILVNAIPRYSLTGVNPSPIGTRHPGITPFQALDTADSRVIVGVGNQKMWEKFIVIIGRPDLGENPLFCDNAARTKNQKALEVELNQVFRTATTVEWLGRLLPASIPCARINTIADLFAMEQVAARSMLQEVAGLPNPGYRVPGNPIKFEGVEEEEILQPGPVLGEHNDQVLTEILGYNEKKIASLKSEGVL